MSSNFPLPLQGILEDIKGRPRITLTAPFIYKEFDKYGNEALTVEIPAGFVSDFNSTPRLLWAWFPPTQYPEAGIVHDWLYRYPEAWSIEYHCDLCKLELHGPLERQECDDTHYQILELKGCRWTKRKAAYAGLRAGGWRPWNRYREIKDARS